MLKQGSNTMTEYVIKTFAETWYEPVIRQLVNLEKHYETDERIFKMAADRAGIPSNTVVDGELLATDHQVSINVGFGATDPGQQIRKFRYALDSIAMLGPKTMSKLKHGEVVREVMGKAGYKNGDRFFENLDEEDQQPEGPPPELQLEMREMERKERKDQAEYNIKVAGLQVDREVAFAKIALEKEIKLPELYERLGIERAKVDLEQKNFNLGVIKEMGRREETALDREELNAKTSGVIKQK